LIRQKRNTRRPWTGGVDNAIRLEGPLAAASRYPDRANPPASQFKARYLMAGQDFATERACIVAERSD
jgi:hypothetical protein